MMTNNIDLFKMSRLEKEREVTNAFNLICRELSERNGFKVSLKRVNTIDEPLEGREIAIITFFDEYNQKYCQIRFTLPDLVNLMEKPEELYNVIETQYRSWRFSEGPGSETEPCLDDYYDVFNAREEEYNNVVRIFFKACKLMEQYKNITIIPRKLETTPGWRADSVPPGPNSQSVGLIEAAPTKILHFYCTNLDKNYNPMFEFSLDKYDFDLDIKDTDPPNIVIAHDKVDGYTYAALRILGKMCDQLKHSVY